jgi:xanthine dehydrogenase accessory factor
MLEIFLEGVFPPPLVQVWGDAPIARALHTVGTALGYEIRAVGDLAGPGEPIAPDAAAVVVASHGRDEEPVLAAALNAGVPYIGLVASRKRGAEVTAALDVPAADLQRIRTPAGLDIGARTVQEIALSIFSEIVSQRPRRPGTGSPGAGSSPGTGSPGTDGPASWGTAATAAEEGPAEATDPVCGMTVAARDTSPHLSHDGGMWYFCGPGCRQAFAADPAHYMG